MHTETKAREIQRPCTFPVFLAALNNPAPSFAGPPRTMRDHVGKREFGDFGAVLLANRRPSANLSERVIKWRTLEAEEHHNVPLHPHPDHTANDRRFSLLFLATPAAIVLWVIIGLIAAWCRGVL